MSAPNSPVNPGRRKSGSTASSGSRRSSRLSQKSPEGRVAEAESAWVPEDDPLYQANVAKDGHESGNDAEDGAPTNDGAGGDAASAKRLPLAEGHIPWNLGEIPSTIRRVYSEEDNEGDEDDEDEDEDEDDENDTEGEKERTYKDSEGKRFTRVEDPLPDFAEQPAATSSNAQAIPSIHEDRGIRFQTGGRFIDRPGGTPLDQEAHLVLKLVDMRPTSKTDKKPKRQLVLWHNKHGPLKDWNDVYTVKKLNSAHQENMRSICRDFTWSQREADFIAERFRENAQISIRELAYRFNNRFMDRHYLSESRTYDPVHTGRTIEAIR